MKYIAFLTNAVLPGMSRERYDVVLSRASFEEMWKPGKPMSQGYESAPNQWMGLSFFVLDRDGQRILGHTGSQAGFRSFYYFNPANEDGGDRRVQHDELFVARVGGEPPRARRGVSVVDAGLTPRAARAYSDPHAVNGGGFGKGGPASITMSA